MNAASPAAPPRHAVVAHVALLAGVTWLFLLGLDLIGETFKLAGRGAAEALFEATSDPLIGLMMGVLATSIAQSSSTTTSIVVALVAAGRVEIAWAVPMVMGANIGTTVTNTLVSFGHIADRRAFERAYAGAVVDDVFNVLAVLVLLPLEITTGVLSTSAAALAEGVAGTIHLHPGGPSVLDRWVSPVTLLTLHALGPLAAGILGVGAIIVALMALVRLRERLMLERVRGALSATLFRNLWLALGAGGAGTALLQSSSVTLSLVVPLLGTGVLSLRQVFPYAIGANIGTTVTAALAALATGSPAALAVAFAHLLFNAVGAAVFLPLRNIPLRLSEGLAGMAAKHRALPTLIVLVVFLGLPGAILSLR